MSAMIFDNAGHLAAEVRSRFAGPAIIGVDGWTGAGKTTLAGSLANEVAGDFYDLDCALTKDQRCYVPALRLGEICERLTQPQTLIFVAGICLRQVFELAEIKAGAHIYVKRMASWGWADESELDGVCPEIPGSSGEGTRREMRPYHEHWKPHLRADYEFHRPG
jgi:hypothetical protein